MYTLSERKFHENFNVDTNFVPKITIFFLENHEKNVVVVFFFAIFLSKQARKKKFQKFLLKCFIDLNIHWVLRFLVFPRSCPFLKFVLFSMKLKKSAKTCKNEKTQHQNGCFMSINHFKSNF